MAIKTVADRFSIGSEFALGPFLEWKPFDSIGLQTGVIYGYNNLYTAGCNWANEAVDGWYSPKPKESNSLNSKKDLDIDQVKFHAINIPFSIRWYPGSDRQFVLHGGFRCVIPLSTAKQIPYGFMPLDKDSKAEWHSKMIDFINGKSDKKSANDLEIKSHFTWDFGFDYNTKSGFIIGMNGLGVAFGYDFTKLLIKA